jgi:hypothetical protein
MDHRIEASVEEDSHNIVLRREVGLDQRAQAWKEVSMRKISLLSAVTDADKAVLVQYAMNILVRPLAGRSDGGTPAT